jgi:hypothetical protein
MTLKNFDSFNMVYFDNDVLKRRTRVIQACFTRHIDVFVMM